MREEVTAQRLAIYSDAVFTVIVTIMVLGAQGTRSAGILGPVATVAHSHHHRRAGICDAISYVLAR